MKGAGRTEMVRLFLASYDELKSRLRRRLGSDELACDVLHETYLRVDRLDAMTEVRRPGAYLFKMALNVAADRHQQDSRLLTGGEVEELMQVVDETPDPVRIVDGQHEIRELIDALCELTPRRRQILIASRLEETPHLALARRFGISTRMVEKELKVALVHCAERLERRVIQRFGPGAGKVS